MSTPVTPLRQPPAEDLRNALQIAEAWLSVNLPHDPEARAAFASVARLIRAALDKLAEPSPEVIAATQRTLQIWRGLESGQEAEQARDVAAVILRAALTGEAK